MLFYVIYTLIGEFILLIC